MQLEPVWDVSLTAPRYGARSCRLASRLTSPRRDHAEPFGRIKVFSFFLILGPLVQHVKKKYIYFPFEVNHVLKGLPNFQIQADRVTHEGKAETPTLRNVSVAFIRSRPAGITARVLKLKAALAGKNVFDKFSSVAQKLRPRARRTETQICGTGRPGRRPGSLRTLWVSFPLRLK